MTEIDPVVLKIDKLISLSRLREIAFIMSTDIIQRIARMSKVLERLRPGGYLLGTGPSTVGIVPLTVDEIVLGRSATVLEEPPETVIDYAASDTLYFVPREVSKTHAKVIKDATDSGSNIELSTCRAPVGPLLMAPVLRQVTKALHFHMATCFPWDHPRLTLICFMFQARCDFARLGATWNCKLR